MVFYLLRQDCYFCGWMASYSSYWIKKLIGHWFIHTFIILLIVYVVLSVLWNRGAVAHWAIAAVMGKPLVTATTCGRDFLCILSMHFLYDIGVNWACQRTRCSHKLQEWSALCLNIEDIGCQRHRGYYSLLTMHLLNGICGKGKFTGMFSD